MNTVPIGTKALDVLVDRAEMYKAFAENMINALGEVFPDTAELARAQLEQLKKELNDE